MKNVNNFQTAKIQPQGVAFLANFSLELLIKFFAHKKAFIVLKVYNI